MKSFAFSRQSRLLTAADFNHVFSGATKIEGPCATFLVRSNQDKTARLGMAIAKKNFPHAVTRNRLRRLVRESFRLHQTGINGFDIVVLVKRQASQIDNATFTDKLSQLWQQCQKSQKISSCG